MANGAGPTMKAKEVPPSPYSGKGLIAGTASGLTKLAVGHPLDSIKVRLQLSPYGHFKGPLDCLMQLVRKEGVLSVYKGASPPAVGWMITDAVLMGSLHQYRILLSRWTETGEGTGRKLPTWGHALAGLGAGWTNSFLTTPVELLKTKLQMQSQRVSLLGRGNSQSLAKVEFQGPIDCARQIVRHSGAKGLWHALPATLLFRSNFAVMFGSYDVFQKQFDKLKGTRYEMSAGFSTFMSGGLAAEVYWLAGYPADVVKNRMMGDSFRQPQYPSMKSAFLSVWNHHGPDASVARRIATMYTGIVPCLLRAFPANAAAMLAFETTMRLLGAEKTTTQ